MQHSTEHVLLRPEWLTIDGEAGSPVRVESVTYRGGHWECRAVVSGTTESLVLNLDSPARPGDTLPVSIRTAWVLPEQT